MSEYTHGTLTHGTLSANGIEIHYVEQGEGPLVIFCHGFPESWYSWRHQIPAVAAAGYRAVALDMRGYGRTSHPEAVGEYSLSHLVGDVVGAVAALGQDQAVVVGHDWGGPVAWNSALMRPDIFRAVAVLSVPFHPPTALPAGVSIDDLMAFNAGERDYYRLYFQKPLVPEAELDADVRRSMLGFLYSISGDIVSDGIHTRGWDGHFPKGEKLVDQLVVPEALPSWLTEEDLQFYVDELTASGFRGGINWYRNIKSISGILAPFIGAQIRQPSLYLYGEHDQIAGNSAAAVAALPSLLPGLQGVVRMSGAGHWLQQERPTEVNEALIGFLASLPAM
jgi:pimeloyl-ACP methyl ester carboxylesterase